MVLHCPCKRRGALHASFEAPPSLRRVGLLTFMHSSHVGDMPVGKRCACKCLPSCRCHHLVVVSAAIHVLSSFWCFPSLLSFSLVSLFLPESWQVLSLSISLLPPGASNFCIRDTGPRQAVTAPAGGLVAQGLRIDMIFPRR